MAKYTEARKRAVTKYLKEKTDDIRLRVPRGTKERWRAAADEAGVSLTRFVVDAVESVVDGEKPEV